MRLMNIIITAALVSIAICGSTGCHSGNASPQLSHASLVGDASKLWISDFNDPVMGVLTLSFRPDGSFSAVQFTHDDDIPVANGTWSLSGDALTLVTGTTQKTFRITSPEWLKDKAGTEWLVSMRLDDQELFRNMAPGSRPASDPLLDQNLGLSLAALQFPLDTDGDGIGDRTESLVGSDASRGDSDGDTLDDRQELYEGFPLRDSDEDGNPDMTDFNYYEWLGDANSQGENATHSVAVVGTILYYQRYLGRTVVAFDLATRQRVREFVVKELSVRARMAVNGAGDVYITTTNVQSNNDEITVFAADGTEKRRFSPVTAGESFISDLAIAADDTVFVLYAGSMYHYSPDGNLLNSFLVKDVVKNPDRVAISPQQRVYIHSSCDIDVGVYSLNGQHEADIALPGEYNQIRIGADEHIFGLDYDCKEGQFLFFDESGSIDELNADGSRIRRLVNYPKTAFKHYDFDGNLEYVVRDFALAPDGGIYWMDLTIVKGFPPNAK